MPPPLLRRPRPTGAPAALAVLALLVLAAPAAAQGPARRGARTHLHAARAAASGARALSLTPPASLKLTSSPPPRRHRAGFRSASAPAASTPIGRRLPNTGYDVGVALGLGGLLLGAGAGLRALTSHGRRR